MCVDAIQVLPSEWGTARKPWFFFTPSYWCPGRANRAAVAKNAKLLGHFESENRDSVEPVEEGLRAQVQTGDCVAIRGKVLAEGAVCWKFIDPVHDNKTALRGRAPLRRNKPDCRPRTKSKRDR